MALGLHGTTSHAQSLPRTLSRRVSFSKMPSKDHKQWDSAASDKEHRGCGLCCAWTSLIIGCFVFVLVLLGALTLSFLQGSLPVFEVRRMNISHLEVTTRHRKTTINADVQVIVNATNKNEKYDLIYNSLKVDVTSDHVNLGETSITPFKQGGKEVSELRLGTRLKDAEAGEDEAEALRSDYKTKQVVMNVVFQGRIGINFDGKKLDGLPMMVYCNNVEQSQLESGNPFKCRSKMFPFL